MCPLRKFLSSSAQKKKKKLEVDAVLSENDPIKVKPESLMGENCMHRHTLSFLTKIIAARKLD